MAGAVELLHPQVSGHAGMKNAVVADGADFRRSPLKRFPRQDRTRVEATVVRRHDPAQDLERSSKLAGRGVINAHLEAAFVRGGEGGGE